ncbi:MAG: nicotinate-nucleotide adenylyltransferase [Paludibacteraceae bacterium]|nr:nicotinate-nucleotide adenylyltransferase [Paludibacteraceae bacterium]
MEKKRVALFFGSFNPIHIGHLALANYIAEFSSVDEVRFVVSPQNPFKQNSDLLDDKIRLEMVASAIAGYAKFSVTDIEFSMPKPSYTCETLRLLSEQNPDTDFILVMGADNIENFNKWRNFQWILDHYALMVYPRPGYSTEHPAEWENVTIVEAPIFEISSTLIRNAIKEGKDVRYFLHHEVMRKIEEGRLYGFSI